MNQEIIAVKGFVLHLVSTEGHIANGEVKEILAVRGFKACHRNVCLGIKLPGDSSRDAVQLNAIQSAVSHIFRNHAKEISDTAARFQDIA